MIPRSEIMKPAPKVEIATFQMLNNNFRVLQRPTIVDPGIFQLTTVNEENRDLGFKQGTYYNIDGQRVFVSSYIANLQHRAGKAPAPGYVPHVVGMTIAQLLIQRQIDVWRSALGLSIQAQNMYERFLGTMEGLQVNSLEYSSYEVRKQE